MNASARLGWKARPQVKVNSFASGKVTWAATMSQVLEASSVLDHSPDDKRVADCKQPRTIIFEECKRSESFGLFCSNDMMHRTIAVWRHKHKEDEGLTWQVIRRLPLLRHQDDWLPSIVHGCPLDLPKAPIVWKSALWKERRSNSWIEVCEW